MHTEQEILDFIELIRESVPNAVEVFTKGNCGSFARILNKTFSGGNILHNIDHAVFEYQGVYYDITGNVTGEYEGMIPIEEYGIEKAINLLKNKYEINKTEGILEKNLTKGLGVISVEEILEKGFVKDESLIPYVMNTNNSKNDFYFSVCTDCIFYCEIYYEEELVLYGKFNKGVAGSAPEKLRTYILK